jgi:hypothetical protein
VVFAPQDVRATQEVQHMTGSPCQRRPQEGLDEGEAGPRGQRRPDGGEEEVKGRTGGHAFRLILCKGDSRRVLPSPPDAVPRLSRRDLAIHLRARSPPLFHRCSTAIGTRIGRELGTFSGTFSEGVFIVVMNDNNRFAGEPHH